mmetsp:Transcript_48368/g.149259  ORF Transcript_48368/g.149259 Transcript_48368/m.149259 type:complete len:362 (+) Transcript_48368:706-1791(+)
MLLRSLLERWQAGLLRRELSGFRVQRRVPVANQRTTSVVAGRGELAARHGKSCSRSSGSLLPAQMRKGAHVVQRMLEYRDGGQPHLLRFRRRGAGGPSHADVGQRMRCSVKRVERSGKRSQHFEAFGAVGVAVLFFKELDKRLVLSGRHHAVLGCLNEFLGYIRSTLLDERIAIAKHLSEVVAGMRKLAPAPGQLLLANPGVVLRMFRDEIDAILRVLRGLSAAGAAEEVVDLRVSHEPTIGRRTQFATVVLVSGRAALGAERATDACGRRARSQQKFDQLSAVSFLRRPAVLRIMSRLHPLERARRGHAVGAERHCEEHGGKGAPVAQVPVVVRRRRRQAVRRGQCLSVGVVAELLPRVV